MNWDGNYSLPSSQLHDSKAPEDTDVVRVGLTPQNRLAKPPRALKPISKHTDPTIEQHNNEPDTTTTTKKRTKSKSRSKKENNDTEQTSTATHEAPQIQELVEIEDEIPAPTRTESLTFQPEKKKRRPKKKNEPGDTPPQESSLVTDNVGGHVDADNNAQASSSRSNNNNNNNNAAPTVLVPIEVNSSITMEQFQELKVDKRDVIDSNNYNNEAMGVIPGSGRVHDASTLRHKGVFVENPLNGEFHKVDIKKLIHQREREKQLRDAVTDYSAATTNDNKHIYRDSMLEIIVHLTNVSELSRYLLGGFALFHILVLNYIYYSLPNFLAMYSPIAANTQRVYLILSTLCIVAALTSITMPKRATAASESKVSNSGDITGSPTNSEHSNRGTPWMDWFALVIYGTMFACTLVAASTDDFLTTKNAADNQWYTSASGGTTEVIARVNVWHAFNALRMFCCFLGVGALAMFRYFRRTRHRPRDARIRHNASSNQYQNEFYEAAEEGITTTTTGVSISSLSQVKKALVL